jgi:hypothetical protein
MNYLSRSREHAAMQQRVARIVNIIERDLTSACMPQFHTTIKTEKETGLTEQPNQPEPHKPELSEEEKKKEEEKKRALRKDYFFATVDEGEFHKVNGKRVELLQACSFITTNALEVYGESLPRLVRVRYELVRDKKSKAEQFILLRKQTNDLSNVKMKISEVDANANKDNPISVHEIARGIKGLFIEFSMLKEIEKKDASLQVKKPEMEEISAFAWGEKKKTIGEFAQRAHIYLELWNEACTSSELVEVICVMRAERDVVALLELSKQQAQDAARGGGATVQPKSVPPSEDGRNRKADEQREDEIPGLKGQPQ